MKPQILEQEAGMDMPYCAQGTSMPQGREEQHAGQFIGSLVLKKVGSDTYSATIGACLRSRDKSSDRWARLRSDGRNPVLEFYSQMPDNAVAGEYFPVNPFAFRMRVSNPYSDAANVRCYNFVFTKLDECAVVGVPVRDVRTHLH